MTTIIYDSGKLYGDTERGMNHQSTHAIKVFRIDTPKIDIISNSYKLTNGPILVGCAGSSALCVAFVEYLNGYITDKSKMPIFGSGFSEFSALLVTNDSKCYDVDSTLVALDASNTTLKGSYCIGSGTPYALGALASGKSGSEAIKIASMFDFHTSSDSICVEF